MNTTGIVPYKTPDGLDELARRTRRLGQRHRTVLLLVDGQRSVDQVLALALAAGVTEQHYRELLDAGLIALPEGVQAAPTQPVPLDEPSLLMQVQAQAAGAGHVELPLHGPPAQPAALQPAAEAPARSDGSPRPEPPVLGTPLDAPESELPAMRSLLPDSRLDDPLMPSTIDGPLEEAREILMRAVRTEAPVAGRLTLLRLKHAASRADLEALLDEVEQRIARPRKMVVAAQTLRHVRHLLCMPPSTAFTLY